MRIAALAVAVVACLGCKDKQSAKQAPQTEAAQPQRPPERPALETPDVIGPGVVPVTRLSAKITYAKDAISVDGQPVIAIGQDGLIDREKYASLVRVLEDKVRSDDPVGITLDATLPYFRIAKFLGTLKRAGFRNLALLAGTGARMIPVELPDAAQANSGGLRPTITVKNGRVRLWSVTGEEGTLRKPKLDLPAKDAASLNALTDALAEIVQRRWPSGKRAPEDRTIIVEMDRMATAEYLLRVLASVRITGSLELFPNIFLAGPV